MDPNQWRAFAAARSAYRGYIDLLDARLPELRAAQQRLADERDGGGFAVETPVVYNGALDDVGPNDTVKLILVADNPGRREQEAANRRYLVGPSGKLADGFFRAHPELGIRFKQDVLILNKTPIHTPRTIELRELARLGGRTVADAIAESQETMAGLILAFHRALSPAPSALPLWIIGYSELGPGKLFEPFAAAFSRAYRTAENLELSEAVGLYRHFSMNQFSIDFKRRAADEDGNAAAAIAETSSDASSGTKSWTSSGTTNESTYEILRRIGTAYRQRILGW